MDAVGDHHILAGLDPENRRSTIRLAKHHVLANIGAGDIADAEDGQAFHDPIPDRTGVFADAAGEDDGIKNGEDAGARSDPRGRPTNE